jgi:hypothetical protein
MLIAMEGLERELCITCWKLYLMVLSSVVFLIFCLKFAVLFSLSVF